VRRHKESDKIFLKTWLDSNMNRRLTQNTIEQLSQQSTLTTFQVYDFLKAEKKRLKRLSSVEPTGNQIFF
jgi:hypothetical protein